MGQSDSESSKSEDLARYDADTANFEDLDGGDLDPDLDLGLNQGPADNGEWQKNTNGYPRLPRFTAQPGFKVELSDDPTPMEIYKLFITDELINSWKASQIPLQNLENLSPWQRYGEFITICDYSLGLDKKPTLHDYWTRHPALHSSYASKRHCADKRISNKPVDVTMRQIEPLLDKGYRLYCDNYYCCPELWNRIQGHNTMLVGTGRRNRVGMPADLFQGRWEWTQAELKNKRKLTTTWCPWCNVGLRLECFEIYHTKRDYIKNN
ncbi:hypothetical protein RRG08_000871 [Elysia crispata]|uniref:PiggyBac transposable element-derived protein domain-containing protein n=1 Tax=Elysia crispata TaxID=231223 RepID=A0AAE0ZS39_9GAST|nr:hypothetical protein RRG08_000871 [Elysia crispata]